MSNPPLSASLLSSLDLANDAVFAWLQAFAIDDSTWTVLAQRAEIAGTSSALSFRHQTPLLWQDMTDGAYALIGRYNYGSAHYAISRMTRLPDFTVAPSSGDSTADIP